MSKQVALFGGAFDPPHLGHLQVVKRALDRLPVDELWLIPCFGHTFGKQLTAPEQRVAMVEALITEISDPRVKLSRIEIDNQASGSTYQTWQWLTKREPETKFVFLMGSDNLFGFERWGNYRELLQALPIYVCARAGYPMIPWYTEMKQLLGEPVIGVSSTEIRQRVQAGQSIADLVPAGVGRYIWEHKLYGKT